jgi:type II secretory pathway component PulC
MIRKLFIVGVLAAVTLCLLWKFTTQAVMYNPIHEIQRSADTTPVEKKIVSMEFAHAWSTRILRNNLFTSKRYGAIPQRKPPKIVKPVEPPPTPPPPPPPRPNVVLSGIIRNDTGEFVAILSINKQEGIFMRKGESVEGLTVIDIQERSVTLLWDKTDEFKLSMQTSKTLTR